MLRKYQLQSETYTSTIQSEVIALEACCRELIPIISMVYEVGTAIGLIKSQNSKIHVCTHEDNVGALVLAQTITPQFNPASKHYAVKTHWFREQLIDLGIFIQEILMTEQLGDICTKFLPVATF